MKRKFLIILLALTVIIGLLFLAAYSGTMAKEKEKKRPTAIPSISIDPYRIPLPIMEHYATAAVKEPLKAK